MASADPDSTAALIEADLPSVAVPNYPRNPGKESGEVMEDLFSLRSP